MNQKTAIPKDAATVILLRHDFTEVLWAQRNPQLKFLGGWHAFPGGKLESSDAEIKVKNSADVELDRFIACAARETFEEVGVLLARGGEKLTKGQIASLHDDLISGRMTFAEILEHWELWLDAQDFFYAGFWTTPQFSPIRFKTRFFLAVCPARQKPRAAISELENVEFIEPKSALAVWKKSEVLISPPVLITLQELAAPKNVAEGKDFSTLKTAAKPENDILQTVSQMLSGKSQQSEGRIDYIELNSRIVCFPLKTETLPPATHTNCFIVGKKEFVVIDAASRAVEGQNSLQRFIDSLAAKKFVCRAIIVSHSHADHFGGETVLQKHLLDKFGWRVPISAHKLTAESLAGKVSIDRFIEDNEALKLQDENGNSFELTALHTPGHARGHLCFYDAASGFLLSSDNVTGAGSVIIAPPEGNMTDYLNSLDRMKKLPNLKFLCGSHGAAIFDAGGKIENYIAHRLEREKMILEAVESGANSVAEIVEKVYTDVSPDLWKLAEKSVAAHLEKLAIKI